MTNSQVNKIKIIIATRLSREDFFEKTATGRSLNIYKFPFLEICLFPENKDGLPKVYNSVIEKSLNDPCFMVFAHDDLHILDFFWINKIIEGLNKFQIIGLVGNRRRLPRQKSWLIADGSSYDAPENLSGIIGHGNSFPPENMNYYGPSGQQVKLLDGLLFGVSSKTFVENNIRFDERFDFHFYDLDFCRQAEEIGLTCGTIPVSLIHESLGSFLSESWRNSYSKYLEKWGE